jgi:hypothetical protein
MNDKKTVDHKRAIRFEEPSVYERAVILKQTINGERANVQEQPNNISEPEIGRKPTK